MFLRVEFWQSMLLAVDHFESWSFWQSIILTVDVIDNPCFKNRFFSCWCYRTRCFGGAPIFTYYFHSMNDEVKGVQVHQLNFMTGYSNFLAWVQSPTGETFFTHHIHLDQKCEAIRYNGIFHLPSIVVCPPTLRMVGL